MFISEKRYRYMQKQIASLSERLETANNMVGKWECEFNKELEAHQLTRAQLKQEQRDHQVTKAYLSAKESQCAKLARENGKLIEDNKLMNASLDAISNEKNPELLAVGFKAFVASTGEEVATE